MSHRLSSSSQQILWWLDPKTHLGGTNLIATCAGCIWLFGKGLVPVWHLTNFLIYISKKDSALFLKLNVRLYVKKMKWCNSLLTVTVVFFFLHLIFSSFLLVRLNGWLVLMTTLNCAQRNDHYVIQLVWWHIMPLVLNTFSAYHVAFPLHILPFCNWYIDNPIFLS